METMRTIICSRIWFLLLGLLVSTTLSPRCDARKTMVNSKLLSLHAKTLKKLKSHKHLTIRDISNSQPYINSPLSMPPFDTLPNSPTNGPTIPTPGPPQFGPSPPTFEPSPPGPTSYTPSPPTIFVPSPPVFQTPVIYPPPAGPPPRSVAGALWCMVKPSVPDPIIQEAMNYACSMGGDCGPLQPNGPCFQPNTLIAHASYAFNSYWQRTKVAGGTCSFGGTAILVAMDPSHDGCHFDYF